MIHTIKLNVSHSENGFCWPNSNSLIIDEKRYISFSNFDITEENNLGKSVLTELFYSDSDTTEVNHEVLGVIIRYLMNDCKGVLINNPWESVSSL